METKSASRSGPMDGGWEGFNGNPSNIHVGGLATLDETNTPQNYLDADLDNVMFGTNGTNLTSTRNPERLRGPAVGDSIMRPDNTIEEVEQADEENNFDRRKVLENNKQKVDAALDDIEDSAATSAIRELAHIVTGDDRFDPDA